MPLHTLPQAAVRKAHAHACLSRYWVDVCVCACLCVCSEDGSEALSSPWNARARHVYEAALQERAGRVGPFAFWFLNPLGSGGNKKVFLGVLAQAVGKQDRNDACAEKSVCWFKVSLVERELCWACWMIGCKKIRHAQCNLPRVQNDNPLPNFVLEKNGYLASKVHMFCQMSLSLSKQHHKWTGGC